MQAGQINEKLCAWGGQFSAAIASGAGTKVLKAAPGRLCRVSITVAGTVSATFFDNPSAASGAVLFTTPATTALGTVFDVQMPAQSGITVSCPASGPGFTVSWD